MCKVNISPNLSLNMLPLSPSLSDMYLFFSTTLIARRKSPAIYVETPFNFACFHRLLSLTHSNPPLCRPPSPLSHSVYLCPLSRDTTVKVWHVPTATEHKNLGGHTGGVTCLSAPPPEYCKRLGEDTHTTIHTSTSSHVGRLQLSNACVLRSGNYRSSSSDQPQ